MSAHLISQDVVPIGTGYLILMGVLAAGLRLQRRTSAGPEARTSAGSKAQAAPGSEAQAAADKVPGPAARRLRPGWPRFLLQLASTALGGYLVLQAVVIGYYYGVARVAGQFLDSAFTGTALLLGISLPLFAVRSWLYERRRSGSRETTAQPPDSGKEPPGGSLG